MKLGDEKNLAIWTPMLLSDELCFIPNQDLKNAFIPCAYTLCHNCLFQAYFKMAGLFRTTPRMVCQVYNDSSHVGPSSLLWFSLAYYIFAEHSCGSIGKGYGFSWRAFFLSLRLEGLCFNMMILPIHSLTPAAPLLHSRPLPGSAGRGLSFGFSEARSKPGEGDGG